MSLWKKNKGSLDKIAGNIEVNNDLPKIVAWAYGIFDIDGVCTIQAGYNIKSITRTSSEGLGSVYIVTFDKPIKDKNYAATVSIDISGSFSESCSVFKHEVNNFRFDCYQNGTAEKPYEANIIVVR